MATLLEFTKTVRELRAIPHLTVLSLQAFTLAALVRGFHGAVDCAQSSAPDLFSFIMFGIHIVVAIAVVAVRTSGFSLGLILIQ